ncbi:TPA_asm: RNA-directed RNA polymerase [ssRNA phage SRR6960551_3]|uniref:RNA-directed RNA polymerase n=1 Tax=ssRNA phage SRR6960551_3 TaxID=2786554 RepID=A0A8S5L4H8_9VIRU|nr:RNA-directed RNA polymerase [ssRNA phage SRR6960551_3]DAD52614.1 TPA_asm: RNA-directed RNA polymerase [ssRNA phage SRR6960551_3]
MSYSDWIKEWSAEESLDFLCDLGLTHCSLGGSRGIAIAELIRNRDWAGLCGYPFVYGAEDNVDELYHARQALALFSKLENLDTGVDKELAAFKRFAQSELTNQETNTRFRSYRSGSTELDPDRARLILNVRGKIQKVLGTLPAFYGIGGKFGPGATANVPRSAASAVEKMASIPTCSENLALSPLFAAIVRGNESWFANHERDACWISGEWWVSHVTVALCDGVLSFVPKNALTYRSIDVQPTVNGFVQAAIGGTIEHKLKRVQVDIRNQERNKLLAQDGSRLGHVATTDLSSASDSIAYEVVKTLFGDRWFELLCAARTTTTTYKGRSIRLEMFSAMGNGFTFPLETLIFWAIVTVVCDGDPEDLIGVYGDDIICPTYRMEAVTSALEFFGFSVNTKKSYSTGWFRESCGGDYYRGISIRPYYQKHLVSGLSLFVLHNFYWRRGLKAFCRLVLKRIPVSMMLFGPDGYGDGHLLSDQYEVTKPKPRLELSKGYDCNGSKPTRCKALDGETSLWSGAGFCGSYIKSYKLLPVKHVTRYPCDLTTPLYACETKARVPLCGQSPVQFSDPVEMTQNGRPMWTYPGNAGVGVVEIYIFD